MNLGKPAAARNRGRAGWRRLRIAYVAEKRTGHCSRRHRCFRKTPTLNVQAGSREALPHKKRKTIWWPWRGRRGLRLYRQDSSHGGGSGGTTEPLTLTRYRTAVAGIQDPGPVRREITNMKPGGEKRRPPSRKDASARLWERKPGGASNKAGGQGDRSSYSRD